MSLPQVALSLRQPWAHAVVHGGKRIENRVKWTNSRFRGPLLIHAAKGMTRAEYKDVSVWAALRRLSTFDEPGAPWRFPTPSECERGGIIGVCNVVGIVECRARPPFGDDDGFGVVIVGAPTRRGATPMSRKMTRDEERWWMGSFALVLADVRPLPFTPCKGSLGFFKVSSDVMGKLQ